MFNGYESMILPEEAIIEFQKLYKARYGQDISVEEARFRAENLMKLYRVTYTDHYPEPEICNKSARKLTHKRPNRRAK